MTLLSRDNISPGCLTFHLVDVVLSKYQPMEGWCNRHFEHPSGLWRPRMALSLDPQCNQINVVVDSMHARYCAHNQNRVDLSTCDRPWGVSKPGFLCRSHPGNVSSLSD